MQRAKYRGYIKSLGRDPSAKTLTWKVVKVGNNGEGVPSIKKTKAAELLKAGKSKTAVMRQVHISWNTVCAVERGLY